MIGRKKEKKEELKGSIKRDGKTEELKGRKIKKELKGCIKRDGKTDKLKGRKKEKKKY